MKKPYPHYAWYCTQPNPAVWSLGRWEAGSIVDIQAQIARTQDQAWQWCVYIPYEDGRVELPMGKAAVFETARQQAEFILRASL